MQKPEHIEKYERILAGLLYALPDGRNCDYLRGAHHMLIWVMRPETEEFDMRAAGLEMTEAMEEIP